MCNIFSKYTSAVNLHYFRPEVPMERLLQLSSYQIQNYNAKGLGSSFPFGACSHRKLISLLIFPSLPSLRKLVAFNLFHLIPLHQAEPTHAQHRGKQGKASLLPLHGTNVSPSFPSCAFRPGETVSHFAASARWPFIRALEDDECSFPRWRRREEGRR